MVSLSNGAILHYENKIMFKLYNEKKKKKGERKRNGFPDFLNLLIFFVQIM